MHVNLGLCLTSLSFSSSHLPGTYENSSYSLGSCKHKMRRYVENTCYGACAKAQCQEKEHDLSRSHFRPPSVLTKVTYNSFSISSSPCPPVPHIATRLNICIIKIFSYSLSPFEIKSKVFDTLYKSLHSLPSPKSPVPPPPVYDGHNEPDGLPYSSWHMPFSLSVMCMPSTCLQG